MRSKSTKLTLLALCAAGLAASAAWAQQDVVATYAGGVWPTLPAPGTSVSVGYPQVVAPDGHGNVYFASAGLNGVFKLDAGGKLSVVAGTGAPIGFAAGSPGYPGAAKVPMAGAPQGLAVDAAGNLFIGDTSENLIRKIDTNGAITTLAGGGTLQPGDGQQATLAQLNGPSGVAVDGAGNLYFADTLDFRVRKVATNGTITTLAGGGYLTGSAVNGQPATQAVLVRPTGVALDGLGNVYIADAGAYEVYKVDSAGKFTIVAGNGTLTVTPDGGKATSAGLCPQGGIASDAAGNLYIPDSLSNSIRKVDTKGTITTAAGTLGSEGFSGDQGQATSARLNDPLDVAIDPDGTLWIADTYNFRVRKVMAGTILTVAGNAGWGYAGDGGAATSAQLGGPTAVALDASGNLFIADSNNARIRKVDKTRTIATVAGDGVPGSSGDPGAAIDAQLYAPTGVAVDAAGDIYIADGTASELRKVDASGNIGTLTGSGRAVSVTLDAAGNRYVSDTDNRVRKIDANGVITIVAGNGTPGSLGDGAAATAAQLNLPQGIALDALGNLYIADRGNNRVRKVDLAHNITTVAGDGTWGHAGENVPAITAELSTPMGVAFDPKGNLLIADSSSVRQVDKNGIITTLAGGLNSVQGIAVDSGGRIYVGETGNGVVRVLAVPVPSLAIAVTHAGNFEQGQSGAAYAIGVTNEGGVPTSGPVVVMDALPHGLTATAIGGTGWSCVLSSLACTRSDALVGGASYPAITLTVNVATNAPASVTNQAGVSGGGDEDNDGVTASDATDIVQPPDLTIAMTHSGNFTQGQTGAVYTVTVSNSGAAATSGLVTMIDALPQGLTGTAIVGTGWTCTLSTLTCTRSDALAAGASYPNVTVTVSVASNAPTSVTNVGAVFGGGETNTANDTAGDVTAIGQAPDLTVSLTHTGSFTQGQTGATYAMVVSNAGSTATHGAVTATDALPVGLTASAIGGAGWTCTLSTLSCTRSDALAGGANYPAITVTVNVAANAPASVTNAAAVQGGGETNLANDTAGDVTAIASSAPTCSYSLGSSALALPAAGGSGLVAVVAGAGCSWTATNPLAWVTLTAPAGGSGNGGVGLVVAPNTGPARSGQLTIAGMFFTVQQVGADAAGVQFVPVTPCRIADTRNAHGPFGGPSMDDGSTRSFVIPQSVCGIPATAQAYSLNVTVAPKGPLSFLTLWPTGQNRPGVSTLNSYEGNVLANAAIVPAGDGGAVNVYVTDATDVILDIDGYFDAAGGAEALSFYAATPCRIADTRGSAGPFGGPSLVANVSRDFPVSSSACGIPAAAKAYSLNVTAVPNPVLHYLGYLTAWPAGQTQPNASTLNSWTGAVVANAAIVPAGAGGAISVFAPNPADVILDANGYFAAPGSTGALSFYPVTPCRVADTRNASGLFGGPILDAGTTRSFSIPASGCFVPTSAAAYSLNVTVVPDGPLSYLSVWGAGSARPDVSTLNSFQGAVVANAAIVPASTDGTAAVAVYVTDRTHVVIDINGYFAP